MFIYKIIINKWEFAIAYPWSRCSFTASRLNVGFCGGRIIGTWQKTHGAGMKTHKRPHMVSPPGHEPRATWELWKTSEVFGWSLEDLGFPLRSTSNNFRIFAVICILIKALHLSTPWSFILLHKLFLMNIPKLMIFIHSFIVSVWHFNVYTC